MPTTDPALQLPLIHLNGTGIKAMCRDYDAAYEALYSFTQVWEKMEFNARDYYPIGPDAWGKARDHRYAMNGHIRALLTYLEKHREHLWSDPRSQV